MCIRDSVANAALNCPTGHKQPVKAVLGGPSVWIGATRARVPVTMQVWTSPEDAKSCSAPPKA
eukprot:7522097-Alexandrium_andersonii.AAC.1